MPSANGPDVKFWQSERSPLAQYSHFGEAAHLAREPRRDRDAIADLHAPHGRSHLDHARGDLVPEHVRKRDERAERVVEIGVEEDLLHVAAAHARHRRLDDDPVVRVGLRIRKLAQPNRPERRDEPARREEPRDARRGEPRERHLEVDALHAFCLGSNTTLIALELRLS